MATTSKWNQETKARLNEKVVSCINETASLTKHVIKASKSQELLIQAAKNFTYQEASVSNSFEVLKKIGLVTSQLQFQGEAIERSLEGISTTQNQLKTISAKSGQ